MSGPSSTPPVAGTGTGATSAAVVSPQPIPYRKESVGVGGSAIGALLVTALLLAVFVLVLRMARSRGLLDRWIVAPPRRDATQPMLHVEQTLRVGPRTTVHRIRDGGRRYLLVESMAPGVQLVALEDEQPADPENAHDDSL